MIAGVPHEVGLLLTLRRVHAGQVTAHWQDSFADCGRPFPSGLLPHLRELFDHGQTRLDRNHGGHVVLTFAGEALLAELEASRTSGQSTPDKPT